MYLHSLEMNVVCSEISNIAITEAALLLKSYNKLLSVFYHRLDLLGKAGLCFLFYIAYIHVEKF